MSAQRLKTATLALRTAAFRAKLGKPMPTDQDGRDLLAALGVPIQITDQDGLEALKVGAVIRDNQGYVCELFPGGWYATGVEAEYTPQASKQAPAVVLDEGGES